MLRHRGVLFLGIGLTGGGAVLLVLAYSMLAQVVDSASVTDVQLMPGDSADLKANLVLGGFANVFVKAELPSRLGLEILQPDGSLLQEREFETSVSVPITPKTDGEHVARITNVGDRPVVMGAVFTSKVEGPSAIWSSTTDALLTGSTGGVLVAAGAIVLITLGVWHVLRRRDSNVLKS